MQYGTLQYTLPEGAVDLTQLVYRVDVEAPSDPRILTRQHDRIPVSLVITRGFGKARDADFLEHQRDEVSKVLPAGRDVVLKRLEGLDVMTWWGIEVEGVEQQQALVLRAMGNDVIIATVTGPVAMGPKVEELALQVARSFQLTDLTNKS